MAIVRMSVIAFVCHRHGTTTSQLVVYSIYLEVVGHGCQGHHEQD